MSRADSGIIQYAVIFQMSPNRNVHDDKLLCFRIDISSNLSLIINKMILFTISNMFLFILLFIWVFG